MLNEILFNQVVNNIEKERQSKIQYFEMEKSGEETPINFGNIGLSNQSNYPSSFQMNVKHHSLDNIKINTIKRDESEDIILKELLELIISTSDSNNIFSLDDVTDARKILSTINNIINKIISLNLRIPPNIIILPQKIYDILLESKYIDNLKINRTILINPFSKYDNKIFLFRKDSQIFQSDFILMTDTDLISQREAKIRKITKKPSYELMNYSLIHVVKNSKTYGLIELL